MTAVAARTLSARRRGRRLARPVRQVRRPPAGARRTKRRWRLVLLAAAAVLVAWALWPGAPEQDQPSASGPSKAAEKTPGAARPDDAPTSTPASTAPSQRLRPAQRPPLQRAPRDLLLAAVRARAVSLRPCVPGDAATLSVPVRLRVARTGAVKGLEFTGGGPTPLVAQCLRKVATGWNFRDVELPSDVELFATLALSPGA